MRAPGARSLSLRERDRCRAPPKTARPDGERPDVRETERHAARTKAGLATARSEQVDKGVTRTHVLWPGGPDANPQAQTQVNPCGRSRNSVVSPAPGDEGIGRAETVAFVRRQYPEPELGNEVQGRPGVVGWACEEGRLEEGGRSHEVPRREALSEGPSGGGRVAIRAMPEERPAASWEVGEVRSTDAPSVMGGKGKGPHFGAAPGGERDRPSDREV